MEDAQRASGTPSGWQLVRRRGGLREYYSVARLTVSGPWHGGIGQGAGIVVRVAGASNGSWQRRTPLAVGRKGLARQSSSEDN